MFYCFPYIISTCISEKIHEIDLNLTNINFVLSPAIIHTVYNKNIFEIIFTYFETKTCSSVSRNPQDNCNIEPASDSFPVLVSDKHKDEY